MSESALRVAILQAERHTHDGEVIGGTGQTIIKRRLPPVGLLIEKGEIGAEEARAADEIGIAFLLLSGGLLMRSACFELVDCGGREKTHHGAFEAVHRYQEWARYWTARKTTHSDPMLRVVVAAVIDERSIDAIAIEECRPWRTVKAGIVAGLRDYAARAGWVSQATGAHWIGSAMMAFNRPVGRRKQSRT